MIGHNKGPALSGGTGWQRHCWTRARAALLPTLPIEVVRLRVRRAAELGLNYRTYASIRAASGHDVIAFLFSTNALHMVAPTADLSAGRRARLAAIAAGRGALVQTPLDPAQVLGRAQGLIDAAHPAPAPTATWREARDTIHSALRQQGWPADRVIMIGDTALERDWVPAAALAWYLPAEQIFAS